MSDEPMTEHFLICNSCVREFTELGAILMSPPDKDQITTRFNICPDCWFSPKFVGNKPFGANRK